MARGSLQHKNYEDYINRGRIEAEIDNIYKKTGVLSRCSIPISTSSLSLHINVPKNGKTRIRLLNAANARILNFKFNDEVEFEIISVDGSPCKPFKTSNLVIGPGQRMDILVDDSSKLINLEEVSNSKKIIAAKFKHSLESSINEKYSQGEEPFYRKPSIKNANVIDIHMQGGAMGNLSHAVYNGEKKSLRDLALNESKLWALNGKIGNYKNKIGEFKKGETIVLRCFNDTR